MRKIFLATALLISLALGCESKPPLGPGAVTVTVSTTTTTTTSIPIPPAAKFTFSPETPEILQAVNFNGLDSTPPPGRSLVRYDWEFGDGTSASGSRTTHAFAPSGTYLVTLTVFDNEGQQARLSMPVTVRPTSTPTTASFTLSPVAPVVLEPVTFNAAGSVVSPGRTIVIYEWDFGDGSVGAGVRPTHTYTRAGTFVVNLTVIDSQGQKATASQQVTVRVAPVS